MTVRRTPVMASFRADAHGIRLLDQDRPAVPPVEFREPVYPDGLPYADTAGTGDGDGEEDDEAA